jgi:hypothetical protein
VVVFGGWVFDITAAVGYAQHARPSACLLRRGHVVTAWIV